MGGNKSVIVENYMPDVMYTTSRMQTFEHQRDKGQ